MIKTPFFSIIIPVYNTASYVGECLDSIKNQTFQDWECICIDDGSKDNSLEILQRYSAEDERIKVFHQENRGQSVARNHGLEKITGTYFTYVDSDDMILPHCLEEWHKALEKRESDVLLETGFVYRFHDKSDLSEMFSKPQKIISQIFFSDHREALNFLLIEKGVKGATVNKVYRSDKLKHLWFDSTLSYAEDSTYYLQILRENVTINVVESGNYAYRVDRPGSHSTTISPREKVDYLYNTYQHLSLLKDFGFSQEERRMCYQRHFSGIMIYVMGAASECYNLLDKEYREKFRKTCSAIKHSTGYYPFNFFMYLRVEVFRGHFNKTINFMEYVFYGIKKIIESK